jgi:RNA polymerase sigma-70 factor (ECF subfamily)
MAISSYFWTSIAVTLIEANGQPAVLLSRGGDPVALATIETSLDGITHIFWHMRPSKLRAVAHLLPGSR